MNAVHVAVGVILDANLRILITRRAHDSHQGGLWEFPGGKLEEGESVQQALARELYEELGIKPNYTTPLINVNHDYADKSVLLDVWLVSGFTGEASGREGQPLVWAALDELNDYQFPAANKPIVDAVQALMTFDTAGP